MPTYEIDDSGRIWHVVDYPDRIERTVIGTVGGTYGWTYRPNRYVPIERIDEAEVERLVWSQSFELAAV